MAQTTILAANTTAATSTDVTLQDGESLTIGLFTDAPGGVYPTKWPIWLMADTPGQDARVVDLAPLPPQVLTGPGTYRVVRPLIASGGVNIGVYTDDGAA